MSDAVSEQEPSPLPESFAHYYIGPEDCKKATCNQKQEFPRSDCPYCLVHSFEGWHNDTKDTDSDH